MKHSLDFNFSLQALRSPNHSKLSDMKLSPRMSGGGGDDDGHFPGKVPILPEFPHIPRPSRILECEPTDLPPFLYYASPKVQTRACQVFCSSRAAAWHMVRHQHCTSVAGLETVWFGSPEGAALHEARSQHFHPLPIGGLVAATPRFGWSNIIVPGKSDQNNEYNFIYFTAYIYCGNYGH